jgi:hypothetical protein
MQIAPVTGSSADDHVNQAWHVTPDHQSGVKLASDSYRLYLAAVTFKPQRHH